ALSDHLVRGRWEQVRTPTPAELNATLVLSLPIAEASAKVRTGPPVDDEEDYALPVWAGVVPLALSAGTPEPDSRLEQEIHPPARVRGGLQGSGPRRVIDPHGMRKIWAL